MLRVLNVDVRSVRRTFRDWLAINFGQDSSKALDKELGITAHASRRAWLSASQSLQANDLGDKTGDAILTEEGDAMLTEAGDVITTQGQSSKVAAMDKVSPIGEWRDGVAGIAAGAVQFEDERDVEDALKIEAYATRFARVIALRTTELPLSVALFGEWGTGKTYFMKLLRQEIRRLTEKETENWCANVVPIRFNAWHYVDTNLWASLVTEIFDQLFDYLAGRDPEATKRLQAAEKLMKQIEDGKGAISEIKNEIRALEVEKAEVEDQISAIERRMRTAERNANHRKKVAEEKLDDLRALLPHLLNNAESKKALEALGMEDAVGSYREFASRLSELRSLTGRLRALAMTMGSGWWGLGSLLILLVLLWLMPVALGWLTSQTIKEDGSLRSVAMAIGSASGMVMSVTGWLGAQAARARTLLAAAEKVQREARKARDEKEKSSELRRLREKAERFLKKKVRAAEELKAARAKVRRLEEELREQRPERRLYRFIEERASAKDYRQHLGLVSLVRRDFRELSRLFTEKKDGATAWENLLGSAEKSVDRIVLYVDDLDRCQPQRVVEVLEAVHLLLDFPLFVAVVAVDPRWVKQSLRAHYSKLLNGTDNWRAGQNQAQLVSTLYDKESQASPLDYLEKIFHIPFHLPGMNEEGFKDLIGKLTAESGASDAVPGVAPKKAAATEVGIAQHAKAPANERAKPLLKISGSKEENDPLHDPRVESSADEQDSTEDTAQSLGVVRLAGWEVQRMNDYAALVQTPRAAKRFLNTYRLVRAGLPEEEWNVFRGDGAASGEFRVAMLLLAATAGSPVVARDWFKILRSANSSALFLSDDDQEPQHPEWRQFKRVYDATFAQTTLNLDRKLFTKWLERVERFAF